MTRLQFVRILLARGQGLLGNLHLTKSRYTGEAPKDGRAHDGWPKRDWEAPEGNEEDKEHRHEKANCDTGPKRNPAGFQFVEALVPASDP